MTAEVFNEFGSRYGYPIYVFSDGTFATTRMSGKRVIFTVEGPIDTNPEHQRQLPSRSNNYPAEHCREVSEKTSFWGKVKQKINSLLTPSEPNYVDYQDVKSITQAPQQNSCPDRNDNYGGRGVFTHQGRDWSVKAEGVKEVKTYHAKDGDKEVFVANYKF